MRFCLGYTDGMSSSVFFRLCASIVLCSGLGAGCFQSQTAHVAEPFRTFPSQATIADRNGFGALPAFSFSGARAPITIEGPLPKPPEAVSVLRLRGGLPNETEWRNITGTIGLPGTLLGDIPKPKSFTASWSDPQGTLWSYDALESRLDFANPVTPSSLTIQAIPSTEDLIRIATVFFQSRALPFTDMRDPVLVPDWNAWIKREQDAGNCFDQESVRQMREQAKQPMTFLGFPRLREKAAGLCGSTEFPTMQRIISTAAKDGLDVLDEYGAPIIAADLLVDISHTRVISGSIKRLGDVDRSDYAAIDSSQLEQTFLQGGLHAPKNEARLTQFQQVYVKNGIYLVPAIIGRGFEKTADGEIPFSTLVPLVRP